MAQHRVGQTPIAPGTLFLCLASDATKLVAVDGARFVAMLFLDEGTPGLRISVEQGCIVHIDSSM